MKPARKCAANATSGLANVATKTMRITRDGELIPAALLGFHRIIWKIVIIALTQAEYEGKSVCPKRIINMSVRRLIVRIRALHATYVVRSRQALTRDLPLPKSGSTNRWIAPIAKVSEERDLVWHAAWRRRAGEQGVHVKAREPGGLPRRQENAPSPEPRGMTRVRFVRPQRGRQ